MGLIAEVETPEGVFDIILLHEFGQLEPEVDTRKKLSHRLMENYAESAKYPVLFSDHTEGDVESFITMFTDSRSLWIEIRKGPELVGCMYLTHVIPRLDAWGHFTFWNKMIRDRELIIWAGMAWAFERYDLERISTEIPPYQKGVQRFVRRLGFKHEGVRRHATFSKGRWIDLDMYGILKSEFEEARNVGSTIREHEERSSSGDQGSSGRSGGNIRATVSGAESRAGILIP